MSTAQVRRDALWDSFCHWTENWWSALFTERKTVYVFGDNCACCREFVCEACPLTRYGMKCDTDSPWFAARLWAERFLLSSGGIVFKASGKGIRFAKAAEHMALVLCLLYFVEGDR